MLKHIVETEDSMSFTKNTASIYLFDVAIKTGILNTKTHASSFLHSCFIGNMKKCSYDLHMKIGVLSIH